MEAKLAKIRVPELQTSKAEISSCVFGIIFIIHCFETNYTKKKKYQLITTNIYYPTLFLWVRSGLAGWFLAQDL